MTVTRLGMSQLAKDAGFGTRIWSEVGYWCWRFYHVIIALGTACILMASSLGHVSPLVLATWLIGYGLYLLIRFYFVRGHEAEYYRPLPQFIRAQIAIALLTFIIAWLGEAGTRGYLWLLYTLQLIIISRHLSTTVFLASVLQVWGLLAVLRLAVVPADSFVSFIQSNPDLVVQWTWIALVGFILHYLVRNIEARDANIAILSQINNLADRRQTGRDLGTRWEAVLGTYLHIVGGQCGAVWLANQHTSEIRPLTDLSYCLGETWPEPNQSGESQPIRLDVDHPIAEVARTGRPLYCRRQVTSGRPFSRERERVRACPLPSGTRARILVPITEGIDLEGRVLGVLSVDFDRDGLPREALLDHYFEFLGDMARRVVPILKYIQQAEEDQTLHHLGVQVSRSLRLENVLNDTLDALTGPLGFELATISLVDEEAQLVRCMGGRNVPQEWINLASHTLDSNDVQADIVRRGEIEVIKGWDDRFDRSIYEKFHHDQLIRAFVPIRRHAEENGISPRVQGVVEVGYHLRNQDRILPSQLNMLKALIDQVAVAIEQAHLFESTLRHQELLAQLHQVSHDIASARHLDQVLGRLGEALRGVLKADIIMIYRFDRATQTIEPPRIFGNVWGRHPIRRAPLDRGVIAQILHEGHPYYAPDAIQNPLLSQPCSSPDEGTTTRVRARTFTARQNIKSFAGMPMLFNGEVVGVLCANYRRRHAFGDNERCVLGLAAQLAAVALRNAELNALSAELAAEEERDRLAEQLHDSVSQLVSAIQLMADTASNQLSSRPDQAAHWLERIQHAARQTMTEVRANLFEMSVATTHGRNLRQALLESAELAREFFNLTVTISPESVPERLRIPIEAELLLICREAIVNAARHADARRVIVDFSEVKGMLRVQIHDDGRGFDMSSLSSQGKRGLKLMRQRVERMGGELTIASRPGQGTTIEAIVPT